MPGMCLELFDYLIPMANYPPAPHATVTQHPCSRLAGGHAHCSRSYRQIISSVHVRRNYCLSKSITFPRHPNVVYVADKRIKECGSRGLGEDVRCVCTSVQYKCTVYSTRIRRGCALCVWGVRECHYPRQLLTLFRYKLVAAAPEGSRGHVLLMTESGQVLTCNTSRHN